MWSRLNIAVKNSKNTNHYTYSQFYYLCGEAQGLATSPYKSLSTSDPCCPPAMVRPSHPFHMKEVTKGKRVTATILASGRPMGAEAQPSSC